MSREPFEAMPDVMDAKQLARSVADFQSRGIQPFEQPGFPNLADRRAQIGDEK